MSKSDSVLGVPVDDAMRDACARYQDRVDTEEDRAMLAPLFDAAKDWITAFALMKPPKRGS